MLRISALFSNMIAVTLYVLVFHSCQQPTLSVGEDHELTTTVSRIQTPRTKQPVKVPTAKGPHTGLIMTSSSDSSPEINKQAESAPLNHNDLAESTPDLSGSILAPVGVEVTTNEAVREVVKKRAAPPLTNNQGVQLKASKQTKAEASSPSHKAWFASFTQAVEIIEQDLENEEAWDAMEGVLDEGKKHDFLTASITCPNDSNPTTEYEYTPLHYAASKGILPLVKELVEGRGISVDIQTEESRNAPLHLASSRGHLDVVRFLAAQGADLKLTDRGGGTALHYAAAGRQGEMNRDIVEYLVGQNVSFLVLARNNSSPLSSAVFTGNVSIIEYWEDNYVNNLDPRVDELTQRALKIAKYRKNHISSERGVQTDIVRILTNFSNKRHPQNK